jgi:uncharacterized membrane protein
MNSEKGKVKMEIHLYNIAVGALGGAMTGLMIAVVIEVQGLRRLVSKMRTWGLISVRGITA